jgi:16S rRNA G966 N2-methylase RsmD
MWHNNKNYYKLIKIFPYLNNNLYLKLQIDEDSYKYITSNATSEIISKIINIHFNKYNIKSNNTTLIELMGGCGGNTISFSWYFNNIYTIEKSSLRSNYLQNNLNLYDCSNVKVINMCAIDFCDNYLQNYNYHTVFIDPPWGSSWNKTVKNYRITFEDISLENFIIKIINKPNKNKVYFIVVKLPKNYDLKHIYNELKPYSNQYLYVLKKMIILVNEIIL